MCNDDAHDDWMSKRRTPSEAMASWTIALYFWSALMLLTAECTNAWSPQTAAETTRRCGTAVCSMLNDYGSDSPVHELKVEIGGACGDVVVLAPQDALERWPAGQLWPSCRALGRHLTSRPEVVSGKRVLELGCGLGVLGVAAAKLGARSVTVTDIDKTAVKLALQSCEKNPDIDGCDIAGAKVNWADASTWPTDLASFDVVLGADLLYDHSAAAPLASIIDEYLSARPDGVALIADPTRGRKQGGKLLLREALVAAGRRLDVISIARDGDDADLLIAQSKEGAASSS